ncbi:MAG TPA: hypothetical protein VKM72_09705 [Thermoanaerobaculia bacterium]|nr:hypothetical protein [Thermoanaerobaculia bacterium]
MNTKKSLAKVFGPVLLLTATLALPVDTAQAAPGHGRAHAEQQKNKKDKQQRAQGNHVRQQKHEQRRTEVRRQQRQPQRRQQVVVQQRSQRPKVQKQKKVQKVVVQQPVVVQRRQAVRSQEVRRQEALRLQAQRQQAYQRQQALERQRALDRQRALARQRQAPVYRDGRRYDNRRYDDRYYATPRRGGGGADPNVFHVDGYLDDGGECLFLRDHEGRTWAMVGNTYGLQPGEHVRLYGRPVDGSACGYRGAAFDIYEVRTVWADSNHKRTYYDHLYDGPFDQNRAYEDDRYYNDRYEEDRNADSWWDRLFGG